MRTAKKHSLILISILIAAVLVLTSALILTLSAQGTVYADESQAFSNASAPHSHEGMTALASYADIENGELWGTTGDTAPISYYLTGDILGDIDVYGNVTLCLNGHKVEFGGNHDSAIAVCQYANFTLCDCTGDGVVTGGKTINGGGVYVYLDSKFTMLGGTISGNTASAGGGGVYVCNGSIFTMNGGSITENGASDEGGGVHVRNNAEFIMNGGTITANNAYEGGGVYIYPYAEFTMSGGRITDNEADLEGGGVRVTEGTVIMNGGVISNNRASYGAGLSVADGAQFIMKDGTISKNTATDDGGGVYIYKCTFIMNGGEISENTADGNGGGVYLYGSYTPAEEKPRPPKPEKPEGPPTEGDDDEEAISLLSDDGGTYSGVFTMKGGEISGNTALYNGGGVCNCYGSFEMSDGTISENKASHGAGVYIYGKRYIDNSGTDPGPGEEDYIDDGDISILSDDGDTYFGIFTMNGGNICNNGIEASDDDNQIITAYGSGVCVGEYGTFIMTAGAISNNISIGAGGGVFLDENSVFTMSGSAVISGNSAYSGGGVAVLGGAFIMEDGDIDGNTADDCGGVLVGNVYLEGVLISTGTFTMNGGAISHNTSETYTGSVGVYYGATFEMTDGNISDNTSMLVGGVCIGDLTLSSYDSFKPSKFTMSGGTISGNTSNLGGGVVVLNGSFVMSGGTITENEQVELDEEWGTFFGNLSNGGVFVGDLTGMFQSTFEISGNPVIMGNKAYGSDNNVCLYNGATINIVGELTEGAQMGVNVLVDDPNDDSSYIRSAGEIAAGFTQGDPTAYFIPDYASYSCISITDDVDGIVFIDKHNYDESTHHCLICDRELALYWGFSDGVLTLSSDENNPATPNNYDDGNWLSDISVYSSITSIKVDGYAYAIESMNEWFGNCKKLISADLRGLDTSRVTDMVFLFSDCTSLISVDLSDFDTSNLEEVQGMFKYCDSLKEIHTPSTVGDVALPLPYKFWNGEADIEQITSADAGKVIYRHDRHTGGTATCEQLAECEICGEEYGEFAEHTGGTATCIAKAICTVCDLPYGEIDLTNGHVFSHYEVVNAKCEENGVLAYSYCSVCNKNYIGGEEKSAEDLIIPAIGHDWGEWTVTKPATEAEEGVEQRVCSHNPSHVETRAIPKIVNNQQNPSGQTHDIALIIVVAILAAIVLAEAVYCVCHVVRSKKARKEDK